MRQFFLEMGADAPLPAAGQEVVLDAEESHHLFTVLRGGRDHILNLTDGRGHRFTGKPLGKDRRAARVQIFTVSDDPEEFRQPRLVLACAVVKGKRFEWALEKAVEVGAHTVIPLNTEHGVIEPGGGKQQRWLTIMKSAVKQCGRSWLPQLAPVQSPAQLLAAGEPWAELALYGTAPWEQDDPVPWRTLMDPVPHPVPASLGFSGGAGRGLVGHRAGPAAEQPGPGGAAGAPRAACRDRRRRGPGRPADIAGMLDLEPTDP